VVDRASDAAERSPVVPRVALVAPAPDRAMAALQVIAVSMGLVHRAVPLTAALCLAAAARIPGTVVHATAAPSGPIMRIGHPLGQVEVRSDVHLTATGGPVVNSVGVVRTARRLMRGVAYPHDEESAIFAGPPTGTPVGPSPAEGPAQVVASRARPVTSTSQEDDGV
jgi:hypothetical protein